ncbi:MAG: hypothetical protein Q8L98_02420 [Chlamydiales bacterium]|nr:hypothetical protein [Chlamydiales bacterium]
MDQTAFLQRQDEELRGFDRQRGESLNEIMHMRNDRLLTMEEMVGLFVGGNLGVYIGTKITSIVVPMALEMTELPPLLIITIQACANVAGFVLGTGLGAFYGARLGPWAFEVIPEALSM